MSYDFYSELLKKAFRLQRHATIVAGLAARRPDGRLEPSSLVREARLIDAEIVKQADAGE